MRRKPTRNDVRPIDIAFMALIACIIPLWVIIDNVHRIDIPAMAEDDCRDYFGAYALAEVLRVGNDHVVCRYR